MSWLNHTLVKGTYLETVDLVLIATPLLDNSRMIGFVIKLVSANILSAIKFVSRPDFLILKFNNTKLESHSNFSIYIIILISD